MDLHRGAGNRAVAGLLRPPAGAVQRAVGWKDASKQGRAWNADERSVGKIRRIPLEGLSEGLSANRRDELARRWVWDDEAKTKGHWEMETTRIPGLSSEPAKGRAIVLVPEGLDATKGIEVLVFLHGFTEDLGRPYAGWRTLTDPPPSTAGMSKAKAERLKRLRQGVDPTELPGAPDAAPVRDVALDQAEQQLEESGEKQLVIVLPQGGLHSQFGKEGDQNFDAGLYVGQIVSRLRAEKRWKDRQGKVVDAAPAVSRINMAGHSGAGATLANMADEYVAQAKAAKERQETEARGDTAGKLGPHGRPRDLRRNQPRPALVLRAVGHDASGRGLRRADGPVEDRRREARLPADRTEAARVLHRLVHRRLRQARQGDQRLVRSPQLQARPICTLPARQLRARVRRRPPRGAHARRGGRQETPHRDPARSSTP
jgi:hypothetical protein